jgi:uncharacterized protein YdeI (YjbR/CyaY-like superfamily)
MVDEKTDLPTKAFTSTKTFTTWLAKNHTTSNGLWLKIAKKDSGIKSITYLEALDVALCYGWIDGQKASYDGDWFLQRFTPRRAKSKWSEINRVKVTGLIERGLMQPAGQAEIDRAKADGRWDAAYGSQRTMEVPDDFQGALAKSKEALAFFDTITRANRYAFLYRIHEAKKPETRAARIEKFVEMLKNGETIH